MLLTVAWLFLAVSGVAVASTVFVGSIAILVAVIAVICELDLPGVALHDTLSFDGGLAEGNRVLVHMSRSRLTEGSPKVTAC